MELMIIAGVVALVVLLVVLQRSRRAATAAAPRQNAQRKSKPRAMDALDTVAAWPPQATRVLTVGERKAWVVLRAALPDHMILAQVPLSRFMKVPTRNSYSEWLRRVGLMSADILVCDSASQVVAVVDVRAAAHKESPRARQRHARMDRVIAAANIPMHVWYEDEIPTPAIARDIILSRPKVDGDSDAPVTQAAAHRMPPRLDDPVDADNLVDAEERRDPPPSTWFDNLDSSAMPLGNVPPPPGGRKP